MRRGIALGGRRRVLKPEERVEAAVKEALAAWGYRVEVTSEHRKRCRNCGEYSAVGSGVTRGIGDVLVWHPDWHSELGLTGLKVNVELKAEGGKIRPDQRTGLEAGSLVLARSGMDALVLLHRTEVALYASRGRNLPERVVRLGKALPKGYVDGDTKWRRAAARVPRRVKA